MPAPSLDIITVNWNAGRQILDCLQSIVSSDRTGFSLARIVVVDNASSDGSAEGLKDTSLPLTVIRNIDNRGFAAACNQGAQGSHADYLLFLNPDMRLFADSLSKAICLMDRPDNATIAICGIQLVDENGAILRTCARFPSPGALFGRILGLDLTAPRPFQNYRMTDWDHKTSRRVDQVMGAFFLVRRSVFEQLLGFDERFFVYFEELDFSLRAARAGWSSFYLAEARAYHKGGGTSDAVRASRLFYSLRSRILYGYKHFGAWTASGLLAAMFFVEPWLRMAQALLRGSGRQIMETVAAYAMLWRAIGSVLRRARRGRA